MQQNFLDFARADRAPFVSGNDAATHSSARAPRGAAKPIGDPCAIAVVALAWSAPPIGSMKDASIVVEDVGHCGIRALAQDHDWSSPASQLFSFSRVDLAELLGNFEVAHHAANSNGEERNTRESNRERAGLAVDARA